MQPAPRRERLGCRTAWRWESSDKRRGWRGQCGVGGRQFGLAVPDSAPGARNQRIARNLGGRGQRGRMDGCLCELSLKGRKYKGTNVACMRRARGAGGGHNVRRALLTPLTLRSPRLATRRLARFPQPSA